MEEWNDIMEGMKCRMERREEAKQTTEEKKDQGRKDLNEKKV